MLYFNGRILGGDHIPSGGQTSANAVTVNQAGEPEEYDYEYYDDTRQLSTTIELATKDCEIFTIDNIRRLHTHESL